MPRQDDATFLGRTTLFGGLDAEALDVAAATATSRAVRAGQAIFRQDSEPTHLYLVAAGRVKIAAVNLSRALPPRGGVHVKSRFRMALGHRLA